MFAILKREVKAYFQTVTGWLFIAAVLVLYGLYFYVYNLRAGYPYISYSLSAIAFIMLITVPVLTMRSFAEERHSRTDQLILTAPVSVGKVVLGKYLAMASVFTIDMVIIAITPLLLMSYGTIPLGECSSAWILAVWLRLHCRWHVYFLIDRKPGDFRSFDICCIICRLHDGKHLQSDLRERKSSDKNFRLL